MEGSVFSSDECVICLCAESQVVFLPCRHKCACSECSTKIQQAQLECPLCRSPIDKISLHSDSLLPTKEEFGSFDREAYVQHLTKTHTKNACFVGKSKQARAVSRHVGNEMEERIKQNAGTDRFGANSVEFLLKDDRSQFTVTYKVKGKRKTIVETFDFIETWQEVLDILKELDTTDHLDICTYYPEYFWLAKYHKEKLPEAKRGRR